MSRINRSREYVADELDLSSQLIQRDVKDISIASLMLLEYGVKRLKGLMENEVDRPLLLLSGGVDSIFLAFLCRQLSVNPMAVTVTTRGFDSTESHRAQRAAAAVGLEHMVLELDENRVHELARQAVEMLGTSELWEVGAAIPILAIEESEVSRGSGLWLTGGGADVLLAGGRQLKSPPRTPAADIELDALVREGMDKGFRRNRLVPDFFERLLGGAFDNYVEFFQTADAWNITRKFASDVLFVTNQNAGSGVEFFDKACLRSLVCEMGAPADLVWTKKNPLQQSSGVIHMLAKIARSEMSVDGFSGTYGDPKLEPFENSVARLWLKGHV
jgi:asparagine synthase (glutamine-hydrolysing)